MRWNDLMVRYAHAAIYSRATDSPSIFREEEFLSRKKDVHIYTHRARKLTIRACIASRNAKVEGTLRVRAITRVDRG